MSFFCHCLRLRCCWKSGMNRVRVLWPGLCRETLPLNNCSQSSPGHLSFDLGIPCCGRLWFRTAMLIRWSTLKGPWSRRAGAFCFRSRTIKTANIRCQSLSKNSRNCLFYTMCWATRHTPKRTCILGETLTINSTLRRSNRNGRWWRMQWEIRIIRPNLRTLPLLRDCSTSTTMAISITPRPRSICIRTIQGRIHRTCDMIWVGGMMLIDALWLYSISKM